MTATAQRIGFITQEFRKAIAGPVASVRLKYGSLARESADPVETFFDSVSDAQTMANERQALLSPDRRRFETTIADPGPALDLEYTTNLPCAALIDRERSAELTGIITDITIDLGKDEAIMKVWG